MNKFLLATVFLLSACGGDSDTTSDSSSTTTDTSEPPAQTSGAPFTSPATLQTETNFTDTFVSNNRADIAWNGPAINAPTSIDYIAQAFSTARAADPTVKEKLRMPQQATWDSYNTSEKVIYLINSERSARGMRPFRGIAPELVSSSGLYATELSDNGEFSHTYGTYSSPTARLAGWANVTAPPQTAAPTGNENTTYNTYYIEELIAYSETSSNASIYAPEARAVYRFMYQDSLPTLGSPYIHRKIILTKNPAAAVLPDSIESNNAQPIIGASAAEKTLSGKKRSTLVVHGVDPSANWDLNNLTTPPGLIGPESETDCLLGGNFVQSTNAEGNNTSICQ